MNTTGNRIAILLLGLGPMLPGLADVPHADTDRIWVTKDGRHLRLGEMSTDHLRNAAAMLQRSSGPTKEGGALDDGASDPQELRLRADMADAMKRVIATRSGRPSKANRPSRLS